MVNCYIKSRRIGSECDVTAGRGQDQCTAEKELIENGGQSATEARSRRSKSAGETRGRARDP
jgi:hypothetical protein